jgi:hypothetical protein
MVCSTPTAATAPTSNKADELLILEFSQILGDGLELVDGHANLRALRIDYGVQAMIQMVVDVGFLGLAHCALGRLELLGNLQAGSTGFDHFSDAAQLTFCALEPLEDFGMGFVYTKALRESRQSPPTRCVVATRARCARYSPMGRLTR